MCYIKFKQYFYVVAFKFPKHINYIYKIKLNQKLIEQSNFPNKVVASHIDFDKYISIDLSHQNTALKKIKLNSSKSLSEYINNYLKIHSKKIAFGGYLEKREIYNRSSHFNTQSTENQRNIHLGIDLWCEANTAVMAAVSGVIHSFKNNTAYGDYLSLIHI